MTAVTEVSMASLSVSNILGVGLCRVDPADRSYGPSRASQGYVWVIAGVADDLASQGAELRHKIYHLGV